MITDQVRSIRRRRGTALRAGIVGLVVALALCLSSCSESSDEFDYMRVSVDGQQTLGISKKGGVVRGVVVFFHGPDADEFSLTSDDSHRTVTETLVDAGFAVASSNASGNAYGNPQSQQNYRALIEMALSHYHVENVFFLAESMGAIAATNILASVKSTRIRGLAAISPFLDLSGEARASSQALADSYPDDATFKLSDPMQFPPTAFAGQKLRFYVSPSDAKVSTDANALAFQQRFGNDADITVVQCSGPHGDPSCFQGDDVLKWFSALERRTD